MNSPRALFNLPRLSFSSCFSRSYYHFNAEKINLKVLQIYCQVQRFIVLCLILFGIWREIYFVSWYFKWLIMSTNTSAFIWPWEHLWKVGIFGRMPHMIYHLAFFNHELLHNVPYSIFTKMKVSLYWRSRQAWRQRNIPQPSNQGS